MTLPLEEQQLLLCAHEECELWQVLSAISGVSTLALRQEVLGLARQIVLKYLDKGWIAIAKAHDDSGRWDPRPVPRERGREVVAEDRNWDTPLDNTAPRDGPFVVVPTAAGENALAAGAAAAAFARIGQRRGAKG